MILFGQTQSEEFEKQVLAFNFIKLNFSQFCGRKTSMESVVKCQDLQTVVPEPGFLLHTYVCQIHVHKIIQKESNEKEILDLIETKKDKECKK